MNYSCIGVARRVGNKRKPDLWSSRVRQKPLLSSKAMATRSSVSVMHSASLSKALLTSVTFFGPNSIPWIDERQEHVCPVYRYGNSPGMIMWLDKVTQLGDMRARLGILLERTSAFFHGPNTVASKWWSSQSMLLQSETDARGESLALQSSARPRTSTDLDAEVESQNGPATHWGSTASPQHNRCARTSLPGPLCCFCGSLSAFPESKKTRQWQEPGPDSTKRLWISRTGHHQRDFTKKVSRDTQSVVRFC